ncbi:hypothetical protein ACFR99_04760 [Haloarchaeobius amylolyticus]|uniref:SipW-cognate class signal peptide n=1 Tax=Haloarchaeobius amylolyticus TaxID=1198296 RepID=A0ABD6BE53_9EURY
MTDDSVPTRRRLLAALGTVGGLAAAAGARTVASFSGEAGVAGSLQAGRVELDVDCDGCNVVDDRLQLALESVAPGERKTKTVRLTVPDGSNSVRLWSRTGCPPVADPLGEALETRLSVSPDCNEDKRHLLPRDSDEWASFTELRRALHDGIRLDDPDDPCLAGGTQLCLDLEYRLPTDATWVVDAETDLVLELFAQQCRHVSEDAVRSSPFSDEDCPTITCSDCVRLGKLEVKEDRLKPGIYDFDELYTDDERDGTYQLEVLTVTDKIDEDERETVCASVRLLKEGSEPTAPPLCTVAVKGGNQTIYYDVEPPLTRTRGEVCAATDTDDPGEESDGQRPGTSNLTVFVCGNEVSADG